MFLKEYKHKHSTDDLYRAVCAVLKKGGYINEENHYSRNRRSWWHGKGNL